MPERLKLRARDARDLETVAAFAQDALVRLADMTYLPQERRFALMLNRFRWEAEPQEGAATTSARTAPPDSPADGRDARYAEGSLPAFERVHAALVFDRVRAAQRRGLESAAKGGMFSLLTLSLDGDRVLLAFAGGAAIRLRVDQLSCHLEDLDEPWPTVWRPQHSDSEPPGGSP